MILDEIKDDEKEDFEEKLDELIDLKYPDNNAKTSRVVVDAYEQNSVKRLHKGDPFKNMAIEALNLVKPELAEKLLKKTDSEEAEDFVDENETNYQFALLDVKNAIDIYGIDIVFEALDLTNIVMPDTMYVQ